MFHIFKSKSKRMGLVRPVVRTQSTRDAHVVLIHSPWLGYGLGDLNLMEGSIKIDVTEIGNEYVR
jgi:hypothetical protein